MTKKYVKKYITDHEDRDLVNRDLETGVGNTLSPDKEWVLVPETLYEITVNYNDDKQYLSKKLGRIHHCSETLRDILYDTGVNKQLYYFNCEFSMPQYGRQYTNSMSRVHHHGIIWFPDFHAIKIFYTQTWHKLTSVASIQLNQFREDYWIKYITKQSMYMDREGKVRNIKIKHLLNYNKESTGQTAGANASDSS